MISFFYRLFFLVLVLTLTNCSTNKNFTILDKDFRKVEIFNQNKELVRTYYQKFNSKVTDWLNVTCVYANNKINNKRLENKEKCRFTNISNSIINNRNKESNENFSINNSSKISLFIVSLYFIFKSIISVSVKLELHFFCLASASLHRNSGVVTCIFHPLPTSRSSAHANLFISYVSDLIFCFFSFAS